MNFLCYRVNFLDIAPQYASILRGVSNTFATIPGIISPILTGLIIEHKVISTIFKTNFFMNEILKTSFDFICQCVHDSSRVHDICKYFSVMGTKIQQNSTKTNSMMAILLKFILKRSCQQHWLNTLLYFSKL